MKKLLSIMFSCLLLLTIVGCDQVKEIVNKFDFGSSSSGLPNPMVAYDSLDAINDKIGVFIANPDIPGKSNEEFFVIDDKIAQYNFEIDGYKYTVRGAYITDEDISGIIDEENNIFEPESDGCAYTEDYYLERFFDDKRQYTIFVSDPKDLDEDDFWDICIEFEDTMKWHNDDVVAGDYQETIYGNAECCVEREGDNRYLIYINWSNSTYDYTFWTIEAKLNGSRLTYSEEEIEIYDYSLDDPLISDDVIQFDGYFAIKDDKLYWTEASQESVKDSVFEKVDY